jgi:hypothetical protein
MTGNNNNIGFGDLFTMVLVASPVLETAQTLSINDQFREIMTSFCDNLRIMCQFPLTGAL